MTQAKVHCDGCRCDEIAAANDYKEKQAAVKQQMNSDRPFTDDQLIYAAYSKCEACGAGMAYPEGIGIHGSWYCSAVLKREDKPEHYGKHTKLPFSFYEVKSENQPSVNGATTRPSA